MKWASHLTEHATPRFLAPIRLFSYYPWLSSCGTVAASNFLSSTGPQSRIRVFVVPCLAILYTSREVSHFQSLYLNRVLSPSSGLCEGSFISCSMPISGVSRPGRSKVTWIGENTLKSARKALRTAELMTLLCRHKRCLDGGT